EPLIKSSARVAAQLGEKTTLTCIANANPPPTFFWSQNGQVLANTSGRFQRQELTGVIAQYRGILEIQSVTAGDFGQYDCQVTNNKGQTSASVQLSRKSTPEQPSDVISLERTWESVQLQWTPGFNGGFVQAFFIMLQSVYGNKTVEVYPQNVTKFNITRLMPQTSYTFSVYGNNVLGKGAYSVPFTAQTEVLVFPALNKVPEFKVEDKKLLVPNDLNQSYCLRVEVSNDNRRTWTVIEPCIAAEAGEISLDRPGATDVNVSICLVYRPDVCGEPVSSKIIITFHLSKQFFVCEHSAWINFQQSICQDNSLCLAKLIKMSDEASTPDLTKDQVIIIGCVCAAILTILLVILVVILCRRKQKNKSNHTNDPHTARTVQQGSNGVLPHQKTGNNYNSDVNLGTIDRYANVSPQYFTGPGNYPAGDNSYESPVYDDQYEYEMNRRNANLGGNSDQYYNEKQADASFSGSPRTPTKDPRQFISLPEDHVKEGGSFGSGNESGYSTPDKIKPKKLKWSIHLLAMFKFLFSAKSEKEQNTDLVPYAHDPPGHTCSLPCCNKDLQLRLAKQRQTPSCIGLQENDTVHQNFMFKGRSKRPPTMQHGFFAVSDERGPSDLKEDVATINEDNSERMATLKVSSEPVVRPRVMNYNFLKNRMTLPEGVSPNETDRCYLEDFDLGESEDVVDTDEDTDSEIEYYISRKSRDEPCKGVPYDPKVFEQKGLYPLGLLREMEGGVHIGKTTFEKTSDTLSSNYYEVLTYSDVFAGKEVQPNSDDKASKREPNINVENFREGPSKTPIPPKLPVQNQFNHPPLLKSGPGSKAATLPAQTNQNIETTDEGYSSSQSLSTKYSTYSSVYSLLHMSNLATKQDFERLQNREITQSSTRPNITEFDFSGPNIYLVNKRMGSDNGKESLANIVEEDENGKLKFLENPSSAKESHDVQKSQPEKMEESKRDGMVEAKHEEEDTEEDFETGDGIGSSFRIKNVDGKILGSRLSFCKSEGVNDEFEDEMKALCQLQRLMEGSEGHDETIQLLRERLMEVESAVQDPQSDLPVTLIL
ncbi:hypothetical protein DPMN_079067, partial [Dreissena polymorpha]